MEFQRAKRNQDVPTESTNRKKRTNSTADLLEAFENSKVIQKKFFYLA